MEKGGESMKRLIIILLIVFGVFIETGIWTALAVFLIAIFIDSLICDLRNG